MKRFFIASGLALALFALTPAHALAEQDYTLPAPTRAPFSDVSPYNPAYKAITCLRSLGVVHGYFDNEKLNNHFLPNLVLNRVQALKLALRTGAMQVDRHDEPYYNPAFGSDFSDMIQYASGSDVINPVVEQNAFRGEYPVTRFEFLKMAIKANGIPVQKTVRNRDKVLLYLDVDPETEFAPYAWLSKEANLMEPFLTSWDEYGTLQTLNWLSSDRLETLTGEQIIEVFNGNSEITRESAAEFLYRLLNVKRDGFYPPFDPGNKRNICAWIDPTPYRQ